MNNIEENRHEPSRWARLVLVFRRSKPATVGISIVFLIIIVALAAPWIAPHKPNQQNLSHNLVPPFWSQGGIKDYPLGTDHLGRDILSRIIYGARTSLILSFLAATLAGIIGCTLGIIAGYYGGIIESTIMRFVDIQLSFPLILLALALVAALGPSFRNLVIVMGITGWMGYTRIVRASTLTLRNREYVQAARCLGANDFQLMVRHILPNLMAPVIILFTLEVPRLILVESGLSFLGLGTPPDIPTWGRMLADGRSFLTVAYWIVTFPGLALMVTVLGINLFGDGLRDALDPRLRLEYLK